MDQEGRYYYSNFSQNNRVLEGFTNDLSDITWCLYELPNETQLNCFNNVPFGYTLLSPTGEEIIVIGADFRDEENTDVVYQGKVYIYDFKQKRVTTEYDVPKSYLDVSYMLATNRDLVFRTFQDGEIIDALILDY